MSSKKRKFNDLENPENSNSSKKFADEEIPSKKQNVQLKPILKKNKNQNTIEVEESKEEKKDELYDTEFEDEYDDEYGIYLFHVTTSSILFQHFFFFLYFIFRG